jgi:hypothetical protein
MAGSNRRRCLKMRGASAIAILFVSLFVPLSVLFAPLLISGPETEVCGGKIQICEECLATCEHKRVRDHREKVSLRAWNSSASSLSHSLIIDRQYSIVGHRLKHDLLAPMTC